MRESLRVATTLNLDCLVFEDRVIQRLRFVKSCASTNSLSKSVTIRSVTKRKKNVMLRPAPTVNYRNFTVTFSCHTSRFFMGLHGPIWRCPRGKNLFQEGPSTLTR